MGKKVLIAEARDVLRVGLCSVFQRDNSVSEVRDVATSEDLKKHLSSFDFDLAVVSQALIADMKMLPEGKFVLIIDKPDLNMLMRAYESRARGYFSTNITAELLRATLNFAKETFFVDPTLVPWIIEFISDTGKRTDELATLSPRERQIATLLKEGMDRHTIANQLHITDATLKTHIKNIARKHDDARWSQNMLMYQRRLKGS